MSFFGTRRDADSQSGSKTAFRIPKFHIVFWKTKCILALIVLLALFPLFSNTALAYDRNAATSYADQWALSRNWFWYPIYGNDCTNFVSQALAAGGYHQVDGDINSDSVWFGDSWWDQWSVTWINAPHNYNFQMNHYPGGWLQKVTSWSIDGMAYKASFDAANQIQGDVLYYDWNGTDGITHAAFQVNAGYSQYMPSGQSWYADLSDQHTTDRYHVSWSHLEVNAQWPTTVIYEVHIDDGN